MCIFVVAALLLVAQAPVLELDHIYVVVQPGGAAAIEALRRAGITIDSSVSRHEGQGTASVAAFFDNAYLELLWVDSSVTVDSLHQDDAIEFRRASAWHDTGASPFGLGLHFLSGTRADLPIPVRLDSAGTAFYVLLRQAAESLAPDIFVMPDDRAVPSWIGRFKSRRPERFVHAVGVRRVSRVAIQGPASQRPRAAELDTRLVTFEQARSPTLVVEFDGGHLGKTRDLRPTLPVLLRY